MHQLEGGRRRATAAAIMSGDKYPYNCWQYCICLKFKAVRLVYENNDVHMCTDSIAQRTCVAVVGAIRRLVLMYIFYPVV